MHDFGYIMYDDFYTGFHQNFVWRGVIRLEHGIVNTAEIALTLSNVQLVNDIWINILLAHKGNIAS